MKISHLLYSLIFLSVLVSCEKTNPDELVDTGFLHGAFITNEGGYGNSNGSVTYLDQDSLIIHNNIFHQLNGRPLGDVVQSISIHENRAYIVVNNSQKVEVIDLESFTSLGLIEGLSYPRYFLGIDEQKGYVSNGAMAGLIYVIDLNSLSIIDSIAVGFGPEQMLLKNGVVYVANSGGWGNDSTLSLIDSSQDKLLETLQVGQTPVSLTLDINDDLWVLCKGKVIWGADWSIVEETDSELIKLNTGSNQIDSRITIGSTGDYYWPARMMADASGGRILFTEAAGLYEIDIEAESQPSDPLINMNFYGFGIDPDSGIIFGLSAPGFTEDGYLHRFKPDGVMIDSLSVGIAPNMVVFN